VYRVVAFPSGKVLSKPSVPTGYFPRAADPDFVLVHPYEWFEWRFGRVKLEPARAFSLNSKRIITSPTALLDVVGSRYVTGRLDGKLQLYEDGAATVPTVELDPH
jgi:hypothetical protein